MSIRPGNNVTPDRSIRVAPAGSASPCLPTCATRPSTITTCGRSCSLPLATSTSLSAMTTTVPACAALAPSATAPAATMAARIVARRVERRVIRRTAWRDMRGEANTAAHSSATDARGDARAASPRSRRAADASVGVGAADEVTQAELVVVADREPADIVRAAGLPAPRDRAGGLRRDRRAELVVPRRGAMERHVAAVAADRQRDLLGRGRDPRARRRTLHPLVVD